MMIFVFLVLTFLSFKFFGFLPTLILLGVYFLFEWYSYSLD